MSDNTKTILYGAALGAFIVTAAAFIRKKTGGCGKRGCCCSNGSCGSGSCGMFSCGCDLKRDHGDFQLVYFPIRGRAEIPRLILEEAGATYRNVPVNDEDMKTLKLSGDLAFGQVPLLRHGDFKLVQSNAIIRYLGRLFNRYGSDIRERAQIDMILDGCEDLRLKYLNLIYVDQASVASKAKFFTDVAQPWLGHVQLILLKNGGGKGFFVGSKLSIADLAMYEELDKVSRLYPDVMSSYPLLKAFQSRIESNANIAAYLKSGRRPQNVNGNGQGN